MKCPVCESNMSTLLCSCGYDASRDYTKYPTFGPVGKALPASALRARRAPKDALRCAQCGGTAFTIRVPDNTRRCSKCGWSPDEAPWLECSCGNRYFTVRLKDGMLVCPLCAKTIPLASVLPKDPEPAVAQVKEASPPVKKPSKPTLKPVSTLHSNPRPADDQTKHPLSTDYDAQKTVITFAASQDHTVTLYSDGSVSATGKNSYHKCSVSNWESITAIAVGDNHTVGLKKDGTVVACGNNDHGQCNIDRWKGIKSIAAAKNHTIGLKKDGTVVACGNNDHGQCNIDHWKGIKSIATRSHYTTGRNAFGSTLVTSR